MNELETKLTFDYLVDRGYVPTCRVGAGNTIYNKWGFEIDIHCNFVYCKVRMPGLSYNEGYISTKQELLNYEKQLGIDKTPLITKMSVDELKLLLPQGYEYFLNKRKRYKKSETNLSFTRLKGRYKITKGDELISEGYNDEEESYFLCHSLLYILKKENLLPKNLQPETVKQ